MRSETGLLHIPLFILAIKFIYPNIPLKDFLGTTVKLVNLIKARPWALAYLMHYAVKWAAAINIFSQCHSLILSSLVQPPSQPQSSTLFSVPVSSPCFLLSGHVLSSAQQACYGPPFYLSALGLSLRSSSTPLFPLLICPAVTWPSLPTPHHIPLFLFARLLCCASRLGSILLFSLPPCRSFA